MPSVMPHLIRHAPRTLLDGKAASAECGPKRNQPVPEVAPPLADPATIATTATPPSTDTAP